MISSTKPVSSAISPIAPPLRRRLEDIMKKGCNSVPTSTTLGGIRLSGVIVARLCLVVLITVTWMRAVVYCRISRDPHGNELGVRRQEDDGRALCEAEGYEIVDVFTDDDRSAYSGKPRPAYLAMRDVIAGGGIDVVVAWHPDRLTRQPRELEDLIDLLEATGTTVRTVQTGQYDLSTPAGRMAARIVGAVARHESEHKSARIRRKHLELAEAGAVSGGGDRPYGYAEDRVSIVESEADVIRGMAASVLTGESLHSICRSLNAAGHVTTAGRTWYPTAVKRVLTSARIAGLRDHHGVLHDAVWPAIITPADHHRIVAILTDPSRARAAGSRRLLTGLLECGLCGSQMVSRPTADGTPCYVCAREPMGGCGKLRIRGLPLDEHVVALALAVLATPEISERLAPPDDDAPILAELGAVSSRVEELASMWAAGELSRQEWGAASAALARRQGDLEAQLRSFTSPRNRTTLPTSDEQWKTLDTERQRSVLASVIEAVVIGPGRRGLNRFDPTRVTIRWIA